ncbi:MAG: tetratricopeptide repeat protein [Gemmatimonadaceae bacterium]
MSIAHDAGDPRRRALWARASVVLLAVAASATSLGNGFTYDDVPIIKENGRVHALANALRIFAQTYWPPSEGEGLYRPLTSLGFLAQWVASGGAPWLFHLVNVLLYAGASLAVLTLAARLLPLPAAWVAAALFAVHPVHVEVVGNVVGQAELWVALTSTLATAAYLRLRARQLAGEPPGRLAVGVLLLYAAACLAKEHGVTLPALLLAAELTVVAAQARAVTARQRLRQVAPLFVALAVIGVAFVLVRSLIVGGFVGDEPHIAFNNRPVATRLWTMLGVFGEWLRLLFWPAHLAAIYSPPGTPVHDGFAPELLLPLAALAGVLALAAWAWRRRPVLALGLAWMAVTLLPTSNLLFSTGLLLAERTLFVPSVGFALALGDLAVWVIGRARAEGSATVRVMAGTLAALLALGVARSAIRQPVWKDNATLFRQASLDEPLSYRAQYAQGGMLFLAGQKIEGERHMRLAMKLMPNDTDVKVDLAREYRVAGICGPALELYRDALHHTPKRPDARVGLVACLLREARFDEAREEARRGVEIGYQKDAFKKLLAIADSAIGARPN